MTKNDLIKRVLLKLREIEADETPNSSDSALIGDKYDEVYSELNELGLVAWSSTGDIPNTHAQPVIIIVAARSADDFYVEEPRYTRLQVEAFGPRLDNSGGAMARLLEIEHIPYVDVAEPRYY